MEGKTAKVLFLCTGNICRSPFAEALFVKRIQERGLTGIRGDSAGLLALPGNHATIMAQRVAREHGTDLSTHRAKPVSESRIGWADLVLVMEKSQERELLCDFPQAGGKVFLLRHFARQGSRTRGIADPYGLRYEAYRFCFLDIEEAVSGLVASLAGKAKEFAPVSVLCYEGHRRNETPRSFQWAGKRCEVVAVLDRWYSGPMDETSGVTDYFKVRSADGRLHILRYYRDDDAWGIMEC